MSTTRVEITKKLIEDAPKPTAGTKIILRDTEVPQLAVRATAAGAVSFAVEHSVRSKTYLRTIGDVSAWTVDAARRQARKIVVELDQGVDPLERVRQERREQAAQAANRKTFSTVFEAFMKERRLAPRTARDYRKQFERFLAHELGELPVAEITRDHARAIFAGIEADVTADQVMRLLRAVVLYHDPDAPNPVRGIAWRGYVPRQRKIPEQKIKAWWSACDAAAHADAGAMLQLSLLLALRPAEASGLRVRDVDLDLGMLTLRETKNKRPLELPLGKMPRAILEPRLKGRKATDPVFPNCGDPRKTLEAIVTETGVEFSRHDLRRTAATMLNALGIPGATVAAILNHAPKGVTAIHYSQPSLQDKAAALERYHARISELIGKGRAKALRVVG